MDINDLIKLLEDSHKQLAHTLNDCKDGPAELLLLTSKMEPLLEDFGTIKSELLSPKSTSKISEAQAKGSTSSQE